jgi:hypothetical protein
MSSDYTDKDTFMARWGDAKHIDHVIKQGIEPMVRTVVRNPVFDIEHHDALMRDKRPYVKSLAVHSPFVRADHLKEIMHGGGVSLSGLNSAMQHPRARVEDVKKVAFEHPHPNVVGSAVRIVHTRKGGWTPEELQRIGNREFSSEHSKNAVDTVIPPHLKFHLSVVPMHVLNSTLPKDHPPLTHKDVNNAMVRERGGRLL